MKSPKDIGEFIESSRAGMEADRKLWAEAVARGDAEKVAHHKEGFIDSRSTVMALNWVLYGKLSDKQLSEGEM